MFTVIKYFFFTHISFNALDFVVASHVQFDVSVGHYTAHVHIRLLVCSFLMRFTPSSHITIFYPARQRDA